MTKTSSLLLDLFRYLAALVVVVDHALQPDFTNGGIDLTRIAFAAVGFFFVLSGWVISYSTQRYPTWRMYASARLSRIYSVLIPVLLVGFILDYCGWSIRPSGYPGVRFDASSATFNMERLLSSLSLTNQCHSRFMGFGSNAPLWSLSYEAMFYLAFGIAVFCKPHHKVIGLTLWVILVGPQVLLLLGVWLIGSYTFRISQIPSRSKYVIPSLLLAGLLTIILRDPLEQLQHSTSSTLPFGGTWGMATAAPNFYLAGAASGLLIFGITRVKTEWSPLVEREKEVRLLANSTFTLYLCHAPILAFFHSVCVAGRTSILVSSLLILSIVVIAYAISQIIERKESTWYKFVSRTVDWLLSARLKRTTPGS